MWHENIREPLKCDTNELLQDCQHRIGDPVFDFYFAEKQEDGPGQVPQGAVRQPPLHQILPTEGACMENTSLTNCVVVSYFTTS